jgi:hypothetical protein
VQIGPLTLAGLAMGKHRDLLPEEVAALREAAGLVEAKAKR